MYDDFCTIHNNGKFEDIRQEPGTASVAAGQATTNKTEIATDATNNLDAGTTKTPKTTALDGYLSVWVRALCV